MNKILLCSPHYFFNQSGDRMNKFLLSTLVLSTLVASCGPSRKNTSANQTYKGKVVLGAFADTMSPSTINLEALQNLPKVVDLTQFMTPVKNQNDRGVCSIFSTTGLIEAAIKKDLQQEVNLSEEYLNYAAKVSGYFPKEEGSNVGENAQAAKAKGMMLERDWSYQASWFSKGLPCEKYKNTDSNAPAYCFTHSTPTADDQAKIIPMDGISVNYIAKNTNEIIKFLANNQRPLTVTVSVNFDGWPNSGDVYYNEALRSACYNDTKECGTHSILLTGYDMDKKVFFFKNSWGKEWGHNGFGTITFDTIDRFVTSNLYYAKASAPLALPADFKDDNLTFESFTPALVFNSNGDLETHAQASLKNIKNRMIYVSNFVSKKAKYITELASDDNTFPIQLPADESVIVGEAVVRSLGYSVQTAQDDLTLTDAKLTIPAASMKVGTVTSLLSSTYDNAFVRSTIYVVGDDGYKILKRVYLPIPALQ
jgi:C1A family cysteine protease